MFLIYLNQVGINAKSFYGLTGLGSPGIGLASDTTGLTQCYQNLVSLQLLGWLHLPLCILALFSGSMWGQVAGAAPDSLPVSLFSAGNRDLSPACSDALGLDGITCSS